MSDTVTEAVRQRLLRQNLNWWKGNNRELSRENINQLRNEFDIEYRHRRFYNLRPQSQKSSPKVGMLKCDNCIRKGVLCSGPTNPRMRMCAQCAVDRLKPEECVYSSLDLNLPAWASGGAGGAGGAAANAIIQPAQAGAGGAGLAIRIPQNVGRGSPTGMVNENNVNEDNGVNSNASRDPNATEEEIAAGRAKKQARRNKVARNVAKSALNNMAAGNESAKAVQAMAKAAGAGGKRSRKRKNLKRKHKFTRKQK
jgi:hypothetical protein